MSRPRVEEIVVGMAAPIAEQYQLELVDVEFVKEGDWILRVVIDKPEGIGVDDCQSVSEQLADRLDEVDPIPQAYRLEVSSPGLDRPLKTERDFDRYQGSEVEIRLYSAFHGKKRIEGILLGHDELNLQISAIETDEQWLIPRTNLSSVRLAVRIGRFPKTTK